MDYEKFFKILNNAISDVGFWRWWVSDFPQFIQLEFGGVQLWNPPINENGPPSGTIALKFVNPISVSFITIKKSNIEKNWHQLLHEDKIGPFNINFNFFSINNISNIIQILKNDLVINNIFGESIENSEIFNAKYNISFLAGEVGIIIFADDIEVYNNKGKVDLKEIPLMNSKWWEYWKEYWDKKDTNNKLPKDYACEVTIPIND